MSATCRTCGAEYSSSYAAVVCQDEDEQADLNNRQWLANARQIRD